MSNLLGGLLDNPVFTAKLAKALTEGVRFKWGFLTVRLSGHRLQEIINQIEVQ